MPDPTKDVHQKFAEVLEALGTNAYQLSKQVGLNSPDKYYKIEKGQVKPSYDTIAEIVALYPQVNVNYYFKDGVPMLEEPMTSQKATPRKLPEVAALRIKHLEQRVAMLEAQNQELTAQLLR
ncbi:helix-turn-helix domain-containing protein [Tunicatimonas pelagia]|uniref:helix-turn-helix domain-containing protein n=1 Tax=Tunicatimonas pelagia TaxID=931531 RepID=UPI0026655CEA|nr:helix-turn-helix transcriptional regulator [Tunicatimonas pelagia]WKN44280.1 helix-turn-helix transcriptional regulator [Tunicatimonas pelagia]